MSRFSVKTCEKYYISKYISNSGAKNTKLSNDGLLNVFLNTKLKQDYALIISQFRVQYDQYFPRFSNYLNGIRDTRKILAILYELIVP